jgi:hypothetical protein
VTKQKSYQAKKKKINMENDIDRQKPIWKEGIQNTLTGN